MQLKKLPFDFTICKVSSLDGIDLCADFYFIGKTDEEISLVCRAEDIPATVTERSDGWKGFRIEGILDFSLIGVLAKISGVLAEADISIFAVSTFHTDYVLVKQEKFDQAMEVLEKEGYEVVG